MESWGFLYIAYINSVARRLQVDAAFLFIPITSSKANMGGYWWMKLNPPLSTIIESYELCRVTPKYTATLFHNNDVY